MVDHLVSSCSDVAQTEQHDQVDCYIHWELAECFGFAGVYTEFFKRRMYSRSHAQCVKHALSVTLCDMRSMSFLGVWGMSPQDVFRILAARD